MGQPLHDPATLPGIDGVDVLLLPSDYETVPRKLAIPGRALARLVGEQAQQVAALWRSLPPSDQMRCHLPRYGVRFTADQFLFEAAICFECNNISIIDNGEHSWATFDGGSPAARELLSLLRSFDVSSGAGGPA